MKKAVISLLLGTFLLSAPALADNSTPPDIVYKKDGTIMRGVIIERIPNKHVEIQLPNGQSRTVEMSEVEYAGPVSETPAAKAAAAKSEGAESASESGEAQKPNEEKAKPKEDDEGRVPVRLTSTSKDVTIVVEAASASYMAASGAVLGFSAYAPVCKAPCDRMVRPGTYKLGVSRTEGELLVASAPVEIKDKPVEVDAKIKSNAGTRALGWGVMLGGLGVGGYLIYDGIFAEKNVCGPDAYTGETTCESESDMSLTEVLIGSGILLVGTSVGTVLASKKDSTEFVVRPMAVPNSRSSASSDSLNRLIPAGLKVQGTF